MGRILPSGLAFREQPGYQPTRYARPTGTLEQLKGVAEASQLADLLLKSQAGGLVAQGLGALGSLGAHGLRGLGVDVGELTPEERFARARQQAAAELAGVELPAPLPQMAGTERTSPQEATRAALAAGIAEAQGGLPTPQQLAGELAGSPSLTGAAQKVRTEQLERVRNRLRQALRDGAPGVELVQALLRRGAPRADAVQLVREASATLAATPEAELPAARPDIAALAAPAPPPPPTPAEALALAREAETRKEEGEALRRAAAAARPQSLLDYLTGAHEVRATLEASKVFRRQTGPSAELLALQQQRLGQGEERLELQRQTEQRKGVRQVKDLERLELDLKTKRAEADKAEDTVRLRLKKLEAQTDLVGLQKLRARWEASSAVLTLRRDILEQEKEVLTRRASRLQEEASTKPAEARRKAAVSVFDDAVGALRAELTALNGAKRAARARTAQKPLPAKTSELYGYDPGLAKLIGDNQDQLNELRAAQIKEIRDAGVELAALEAEGRGARERMGVLLREQARMGADLEGVLGNLNATLTAAGFTSRVF